MKKSVLAVALVLGVGLVVTCCFDKEEAQQKVEEKKEELKEEIKEEIKEEVKVESTESIQNTENIEKVENEVVEEVAKVEEPVKVNISQRLTKSKEGFFSKLKNIFKYIKEL